MDDELKVVIPAAGVGTRVMDMSPNGCKELIEVAKKHLLFHTIDHLLSAGINEFTIVTSPAKPEIKQVLDNYLQFKVGRPIVHYSIQESPIGFVDAVSCGVHKDWKGSVLVAVPDNLFVGMNNPAKVLLNCWRKNQVTLTGVVRVREPFDSVLRDTGRIISSDYNQGSSHPFLIHETSPKMNRRFPLSTQGTNLRKCGWMIWGRDFWELAGNWNWGEGEIDDTPILNELALHKRLYGVDLNLDLIDVGIPEGVKLARTLLGGEMDG